MGQRVCLLMGLIGFTFLLNSCGKPSNRAGVSGFVTCDGQPVEDGLIQFTPAPGVDGPLVQIQIQQGKYESPQVTRPTIGKNSVQITATKKTGKKVNNIMGEATDEQFQYIPARYNSDSELTVDIQPGNNQFDFKLSSE